MFETTNQLLGCFPIVQTSALLGSESFRLGNLGALGPFWKFIVPIIHIWLVDFNPSEKY